MLKMKLAYPVSIFIFVQFFMNCNPKNDSNQSAPTIEEVTFVDLEEEVEPPPPGLTSKFNSIEEWLTHICETEKPAKSIDIYHFGLFESTGSNTIYLLGLNKFEKGDTTGTRIEFQPGDMYFRLPLPEFNKLSREELLEKLRSQLNAFLSTTTFKNCFLAKASSITSDYLD